jgi:hypothetical protein
MCPTSITPSFSLCLFLSWYQHFRHLYLLCSSRKGRADAVLSGAQRPEEQHWSTEDTKERREKVLGGRAEGWIKVVTVIHSGKTGWERRSHLRP